MPVKQRKSVRRRIRWSKASSFLNLLVFLAGIIGIVLIILFIHYPKPKQYPSDRFERYTFKDTLKTIDGNVVENESAALEIISSKNINSREVTVTSENQVPSVNATSKIESKEINSSTPQTTYRFYIITGSFQNHNNAEVLQKKLINEGYASSIIESRNNLFRVTLGAYELRENANMAFQQFRKGKYKDIWILEVQ